MKTTITLIFLAFISITGFSQNDVKDKFLATLNGTEAAAERAIATFGSSEVIANGMIPFGKNPQVTAREENCVWFTLQDEDEVNEYYICSTGDKITDFQWADTDEEEDDEE